MLLCNFRKRSLISLLWPKWTTLFTLIIKTMIGQQRNSSSLAFCVAFHVWFGLVTLARRTLVSNVDLQPLFTHKQATLGESSEEAGLKLAYSHGKSLGLLKPNDQVVVFEKVGDSSVVKIVEYEG